MLTRRGLITGLVAFVAAPAVIRTPGLLMPVRSVIVPKPMNMAEVMAQLWREQGAVIIARLERNNALLNPLLAHLAARAA